MPHLNNVSGVVVHEAVGNATTDYYYDHAGAGKLFVELGIFSSTHAVDFYFENCL